jgi:predicted phage terminase large subunit-like protein
LQPLPTTPLSTTRNDELNQIAIREEMLRRKCLDSLSTFTRTFWHLIEPGQPYVHGWHIDTACKHLEAAARFQLLELLINWPPRHMKSILVNVMFPAWVWAHEDWASRRFMSASYSGRNSVRDGLKMRTIIESPNYKSLFKPSWRLRIDQNQKLKFDNTKSGFRFSTSVGGSVTGEGADFLIMDDPINAMEANSEIIRIAANEWWDIAWSTRANNPNAHCKIVIMQRLHENDLTGHITRKIQRASPSRRAHLVFQAKFEKESKVKSHSPFPLNDPRTKEGELLWPERFDAQSIQQLAADLDSTGLGQSHAQLQQDPRPKSGGLFKRAWWKRYEKPPSSIHEVVTFNDSAQKPGITNDWTIFATWARCADGYYLLDLWREKVEAPALEAIAVQKYLLLRPHAMVIEDKSAGSSLIQYLVRLNNPIIPVIPYNPKGDKEVRATAATPTVQSGKCYLPARKIIGHDEAGNEIDLVEEFISEHERFPKSSYDDMVDTTSMMVDYFAKRIPITPRIRSL